MLKVMAFILFRYPKNLFVRFRYLQLRNMFGLIVYLNRMAICNVFELISVA